MTVRRLELDVVRWEELVRLGVDRTVGASEGAWTLHSPIDPGITILEALAWQIEQRLFRLDQVNEATVRSSMALLGVEPPRDAVAATTVLAATSAQHHSVARGASVRVDVAGRRLCGEVEQATAILGGDVRVGVVVGGVDRTSELGDATVILTGADGHLDVAISIEGARPGGDTDRWRSIYIGLVGEDDPGESFEGRWASRVSWVAIRPPRQPAVHGAWRPVLAVNEASGVALVAPLGPPVAVTWSMLDGAGRELESVEVLDGTDGFRRSGIIHWRLGGIGLPDHARLWARSDEPWPIAPPRLRRVDLNAIVARHRSRVHRDDMIVGDGWLPDPGLELELDVPTEEDRPFSSGASLDLRERDGVTRAWRSVTDLAAAAAGDRVFQVDRQRGVFRFGDGLHGRVPLPALDGEPNATIQYVLGGGATPEVGAGVAWRLDGLDEATLMSVLPLAGGREAETIDEAAARARLESAGPSRIVSASDAERAATRFTPARLARAHGEPGIDPSARGYFVADAITVFCVPTAPTTSDDDLRRRPTLDEATRRALQQHFDARCVLGSRLFVAGPNFVDVDIVVRVRGDGAAINAVRSAVDRAIRRVLHPIVGGVDKEGWPFGGAVGSATVLTSAQVAAGRYVDVVEVIIEDEVRRAQPPPEPDGSDDEDGGRSGNRAICRPVAIQPFQLPWPRTVRVERMDQYA